MDGCASDPPLVPSPARMATHLTLTVDVVVAHAGALEREQVLDAVLGEGSPVVDVLEIAQVAYAAGMSREVRYA